MSDPRPARQAPWSRGGRGPREAGGESGPVRRGDAARRRNSSGSGIPPV